MEVVNEVAPGTQVELLAEGYADGTHMLVLCIVSLTLMLTATSQWVQVTRQQINVGKLMIFEVQHKCRGPTRNPEAELSG